MNLSPNEIITIQFPFSDFSRSKQRPVIAITSPDRFGDFSCLAITSKETQENSLSIETSDMLDGKLPKKSWVRFDKIFTLNSSLIQNHVGKLKDDKYLELKKQLCEYLGC